MKKQYHPQQLESNCSRGVHAATLAKCRRQNSLWHTLLQKQQWLFALALVMLLAGNQALGQSTTTVLPNADVNAGDWSPTPLFSRINTADGVFISSPSASHSTAEVAMENPTDPGVYSEVEVTFRVKKQQTGGNTKGLDANIRINGALQGNRTVSTDLSGTFTDITVSWTGLNFTRAEMETLQVVFTSTGQTAAGGNSRTVDVDFVEAALTYTGTQYTLTVDVVGDGTVEVNDDEYIDPIVFDEGATVNLQALANPGWEFTSWSGDLVSTNPSESILMDADKSITATFNELLFNISGTILEGGAPLENVSVEATGGHTQTVLTDANGEYTLTSVAFEAENITITPELTGYVFNPGNILIAGPVNDDITDQDFSAELETFSISGEIMDGAETPLSGVSILATGGHTQTVLSLSDGTYSLTGVEFGAENISITPSLAGYTFNPVNILVAGPVEEDVIDQDFTGSLPPIAEDDAFCIQEETDLDVLANDIDPYGSDFDFHTVTIVSVPANGSATVNADNTIQFDPDGMNENESVSFVYRVAETNNTDIFDEATVSVVYSTENDPPVANDNTANTSSELPVTINVLANDTDPKGGALFVDAIVTGPSSGSAVINPDNTITYTPFAGFEGTDTFVYRVCDNGCGSLDPECAEATVTVNVIDAYYVCQDGISTVRVDEIPGAIGYLWDLPAGAVITDGEGTNELTVDWSGVAPGEYEVCVEPENDCGPGTEQCINVVVIDIELTAEAFDESCLGENNGSIELTIDGGIPPYSFSWTKDGSPTSLATQNPGGLEPGVYEVTVTDKYGCVGTTSATITEPDTAVEITSSSITDETSPGAADGAINITVTGGTPGYTYLWSKQGDPSFIATTQDISNLSGGTYTVLITDENGCTLEESFTVNQTGGPLQISAIIATDVDCHGEDTGTINLEVIGGSGSYTYVWTASDGGNIPDGQENNQDLTGLVAGTYEVTVDDGTDTVTESVVISEPAEALTVVATPSDISCFGANDGSISLDVSGGTEPYSYLWANGSTSESLNDLSAGTYSVTVTDANGCFITETAEIEEPDELVIDGEVTASSCDDNSSGSIVLTVSGGTGAYTYSWTGPDDFTSTDEDLADLAPGSYSVAVTDAEDCTTGKSFVVRNTCIDIEKTLLSGPDNNGDGTYDLTYQLTVKNTGNTNLFDVQVTEDLGATFDTFDNVSISSSKFAMNAGYTGATPDVDLLDAGQTLVPGEEGRINISFRVTPGFFDNPYENTVTATAEDTQEVSTQDTGIQEVNFEENPVIGLAKAVTDGPFINEDGSYDLSFLIIVRNYGDVPLNNVQVIDNLDDAFGTGAYTVNTVSTTAGLTPNPGFNGSGDQDLLTGADELSINQIEQITIELTVTPDQLLPFENQALGSASGPGGTTVSDLSQEGTDPDPDNDGDPTNNDDPTAITFTENPGIGLAKRLLSTPVNNNDGTYTFSFEFLVKNTGDAGLAEVQIFDDLDAVFDGKLVSVDDFSSAFFTANPSFDGETDKNILAGTDILAVDEEETLQLTITVEPGDDLGPYENTAEASATSLFGSTVTDTSHDGVDVDPDNTGPENHDDPTPVSFAENPQITANKTVADVINNGDLTYDVVYAIEISNTGDVPLSNIQATDDLSETFGDAIDFEVIDLDAPGFTTNNDYDGTGDINLLAGTDNTLAFGETKTINLTVQVTPGTNLGEYVNTVNITANSPAGTPATDDSVGVTFSENPVLGLAKELISLVDDGEGEYTVTYVIYAENMGDVPLTNIQIVDDLEEAFEPIGNENWSVVSIDSNDFTLDGDYDGTTLQSEMLIGDDELLPGESGTVTLVVTITPGFYNLPLLNIATGTGISPALQFVIDLSQDGDDPAPDGSGDPSRFSDPTPVEFPNVIIGATKRVTEGPDLIGDGVFSVTYEVRAQNLGDLDLFDVQVFDRLDVYNAVSDTTGFGAYVSTIAELESPGQYTLAEGPEITGGSASGTFTINPAFTGAGTATALFELGPVEEGNNTLLPSGDPESVFGEDVVVSFTIQFIPPGDFLAFYNQAFASGDATETGTAEGNTTDPSNDGTEMFEDPSSPFPNQSLENDDLWDNNTPTVFELNEDADLAITKTVDDATPDVGDEITFTITVTNAGPSNATGVEVTDELPTGLTYESSAPSQGSYDVQTGIWDIGTLDNLAEVTLTITALVTEDAVGGVINTAAITASDQDDPDPENNEDDQEVNPKHADLAITKQGPNTVIAGEEITYTITVNNLGPNTAENIQIFDDIPAEIADPVFSTDDFATSDDWTSPLAIGDLPSGESHVIKIRGTIQEDTPLGSIISNTATVESDTYDPNEGNTTSTKETDINTSADLNITKDGPNEVIAGTEITYTITVTNEGPSTAQAVQVSDNVPSGILSVTYSDDGGATWSAWSSPYAHGTLEPGDSFSFEIKGIADPSLADGSTLTNTATVNSSTPDPDTDNNTSTVSTDIIREAELSITKTQVDPETLPDISEIDPSEAAPGTRIYYLLIVENFGPSYATGAEVADDLPAGITNPQFSLNLGNSWAAWDGTRDLGNFEFPGINRILIRGDLDPSLTGSITNTATFTSPSADEDVEDSVNTELLPSADLAIIKEVVGGTVSLNETITYRLTIDNNGPSTATGIEVEDIIDTDLIDDPEYSLDNQANWEDWPGSVSLDDLEPSDPAISLFIRGTLLDGIPDPDDEDVLKVPNTATVTSSVDDPNPDNNSFTVVTTLDVEADLELVKTGPATVAAGNSITYTLTVENLSDAFDSENVIVEDIINTNVINDPEYSFDEEEWTSWPSGNVLALGTVSPSTTVTFYIRGIVAPDVTGTITNTAEVFSSTPDPDIDNDKDSWTTDVEAQADLEIVKLQIDPAILDGLDEDDLPEDLQELSIDPLEITAGETIHYLLVYRNLGPSDAPNVTITDEVPDVIENVESSRCRDNFVPYQEVNNLGTVVAGGTCIFVIRGTVRSDATDEIINTATIASDDVTDPNDTNTSSTVVSPVVTSADLSLQKTGTPNPVVAGEEITYTITVENSGPSDALEVMVYDEMDERILNPEYSLDGGSNWDEWADEVLLGTITNSATVSFQIRGTVDPSVPQTNQIENTATVSSTLTPDPNPNNNSSTATNSVNRSANLEITKSADPDPVIPGQTLTYTITVENIGPSDARSVVVTDNLPAALLSIDATPTAGEWTAPNWTIGDMAAGSTQTLTITATVGELADETSLVNTAEVDSTTDDPEPENNTSTVTSTITASPEISLSKTADKTEDVQAGETITYTYEVTNTGNVAMNDITLVDDHSGTGTLSAFSPEPPLATLAAGASEEFTASYVVTQADIDGQLAIVNTATATASFAGVDYSAADDETVAVEAADASIAIVKTGTLDATVVDPADRADAGDIVHYTFRVENTGNVTLVEVEVSDLNPQVDVNNADIGTMAPGAVVTLTGSYTLTQADIDAGVFSNTASVAGNDPEGNPIDEGEDEDVLHLDQVPLIAMTKTASQQTFSAVDEEITYTISVENTGNVTIEDITIEDPLTGDSFGPLSLEPGQTDTFSANYTITQTDLNTGSVHNTATASGTDPNNETVEAEGEETIAANQQPSIALVKEGTYDAEAGEITYTFTVHNKGNVSIDNLVVDDAQIGVSNLAVVPSTLAPDATGTATAVYAVSQADRDAGVVTNTATATGEDPNGDEITDTSGTDVDNDDPTVTLIDQDPEIALVKEGSYDASEGEITYTFTVTNTGDVTISGIVINDAQIGVSDLPISPATLAPDESGTATVDYTVSQADRDAGAVTNTATATGEDPNGDEITDTSGTDVDNDDPTVTPVDQEPEIALVKEGAYDASEGEISYTFTVTNTGNVTIEDIVIDDALIGVENLSITPSTLAPTESGTATYVYEVTQADIDAGGLANQALATGKDPNGDDVTDLSGTAVDNDDHTVTNIDQNPQIALVKTGSYNADTGEITYSFTVHNTGNVTISDIVIQDEEIGVIDLDISPATLAPVESGSASAAYAVMQADIDAGVVTNTAIASGTDPQGGTVTDTSGTDTDNDDPTETNVPQEPGIVLVKEGEFQGASPALLGDQILYTFTITNTGNVTLTDVSVTDDLPGLSSITPASVTSLTPDATATFSATYAITQDDLDTGDVENQALATGNDPVGTVSATSGTAIDNEVPTVTGFVQDAELTLEKTASPETFVAVGDIISYTFTVENTGNVTISDITLDDPMIDDLTDLDIGELAPGGIHTEVHTYVITSDDLSAGSVVNTATATGTGPDDQPVEASGSVTAEAISADMAITKTVSPDQLIAGEEVIYTIEVKNKGPIDAVGVVITEDIPEGLSQIAVNTTIGSWIAPEWEIGNMPVGRTHTMTINARVNADFTGDINNEAFVISDTPDPVMENNSSSTESQTDTSADVEIVKTQIDHFTTMNEIYAITAGTKIYYRLLVTNYGPSFAQNTVITDNLPDGLTNAEYSLNDGASWDPWDGTRTLDPFDFPGVNDILIRADVDTDATGTLTNTATVTSDTHDPDLDNNESEVTTQINTEADLTLTKVANTSPVIKGEPISYTLTVTNLGPSDAQDVVITDIFDPANITGVEYFDGNDWVDWTESIDIGTLAYDDTYTLVLWGDVEPDADDVIPNTATVTSSTDDPNLDNNSRTINTPVDAEADLEIVKTGPSEVVAGEEVSWVITVTNHGPSDATEVEVTDNLPATLVNRTFSTDGGDTWDPWTGSLNLGDLDEGGTVSFTLKADIIPDATGVLTNTASVSSDFPDPEPGNNSSTTVSNINVVADLEVYKIQIDPSRIPVDENELPDDLNDWAVDDPTLEPFDEIYYLIVYGNKGPSEATNVVVEDILPAAIIDAESSRCQAGFVDWNGSTTVGSITAGEKCVIIIRGTISPTFTGTIENTATISSTFVDNDPDMDNNSSTFVTEIISAPVNVEAWVYLEGASVVPGQCGEYTLSHAGDLMRTDLNDLRLLPGQTSYQAFYDEHHTTPAGQPYSGLPWEHAGNEGATYIPSNDNSPGDAGYSPDVVDWVLVSIREDADGPTISNCRAAGLLRNNGRIVFDEEAFAQCELVPTNQYHLVIEHRNHLQVMSQSVEFKNNIVGWDFRMQQSHISNGTSVGQKEIPGGLFVMFGGNADQSTETDGTTINEEDFILWQDQNGTINRYRVGDFDMNGDTNYNDKNLWEINQGKSTSVPWEH